jgi:hypothetical protein
MLTINNNIVANQNTYGLSRNQPKSNIYSIQNNNITDTFSRKPIEEDIRYSFTFSQRKLNPKITINNNNVTDTKKEPLFESSDKTNEPRQEIKRERIVGQPKEIYNLIGADTEQINSNNNKAKRSTTYQLFQNIVKDATKEYKILLSYYNSRITTLDTFA